MFNQVQQSRRFACVKTDNRLLMKFRHVDQKGWICLNHLSLEVIGIEAPQSRHLALETFFTVGVGFLTRSANKRRIHCIDLQKGFIFLDIGRLDLIKDGHIPGEDILLGKDRVVFLQIPEKGADVVGVRQSRPSGCRGFNSKEILLCKRRKSLQNFAKLEGILDVLFVMIAA